MTKKTIYCSHWQYTLHENLNKFIPHGFTSALVTVKELLDNACDAAEKDWKNGFVNIRFDNGVLEIENPGVISKEEFEVITDFSLRISDKYIKRSFVRGQIGHGLKIALMMGLSEDKEVRFDSGAYTYIITLNDRRARDPKEVLNVESKRCNLDTGTTTVTTRITDNHDEAQVVEDYILKYIALNPQISFKYNYRTFDRTVEIKKSDKVDIFSYDKYDFKEFAETYFQCNFSIEEFVRLFNIKKTKLNEVVEKCKGLDRLQKLYRIIRENSKRLVQPLLGKDGIEKRMEEVYGDTRLKSYKKVRLEGNSFAEIAFFSDDSPFVVAGINGSCMPSTSINLTDKFLYSSLKETVRALKIKDTVFFSYYSTSPDYSGTNKQWVRIYDQKVYNAIKRLCGKAPEKKESSKTPWLCKKEEYKAMARADSAIIASAKEKGFSPYIYLFIMECREIAESMVKRFGPITLRQLYYQLVSRNIITNAPRSYDNFKNHMANARETGLIEYDIFEDRSRHTIVPSALSRYTDVESYVRKCVERSLTTPTLDIWEDQPYHVEVWIEKDALVTLFSMVARKKQVPLFPSRGFTSLTKIEEARKRFREKIEQGKKVVLLYAGDLDPSGWGIYENICNKFRDEEGIELKRFALNPDQTTGLEPMPIKSTDSRHDAFRKKHPDIKGAYELDAMNPDELQRLTEEAIDDYFDPTLLPQGAMEEWRKKFDTIRKEILRRLEG